MKLLTSSQSKITNIKHEYDSRSNNYRKYNKLSANIILYYTYTRMYIVPILNLKISNFLTNCTQI